jgi:hypothetical protein
MKYPFCPGGIDRISEQRVVVRIMNEHHHGTPVFELRPVIRIAKHKHSTSERDHNRGVWERLPMDQLIGGRPDALLAVVRSRDVPHKNCGPNSEDPHKQRGPSKNHCERRHRRDTAKIPLRVVLLRMARTNENAFHIPGSTFLQKRGPDIFPDVVSHQEKRYPISATKVHKSEPNLGPRGQRENVTPM